MGRRPPGGDACVHVREKAEPAARMRVAQARAIPARGWARRHSGNSFRRLLHPRPAVGFGPVGRWHVPVEHEIAVHARADGKLPFLFPPRPQKGPLRVVRSSPRVMRPGSSAELALRALDRSHPVLTLGRETRTMARSEESPGSGDMPASRTLSSRSDIAREGAINALADLRNPTYTGPVAGTLAPLLLPSHPAHCVAVRSVGSRALDRYGRIDSA
jgi:hypothetical protein